MEQKLFYSLADFNALKPEKRRELFDSYTFSFVKEGVRLNPRHEKLKASLMYSSKN